MARELEEALAELAIKIAGYLREHSEERLRPPFAGAGHAYRDWLESEDTVHSGHVGRWRAFEAGYAAGRAAAKGSDE